MRSMPGCLLVKRENIDDSGFSAEGLLIFALVIAHRGERKEKEKRRRRKVERRGKKAPSPPPEKKKEERERKK